MDKKMALVVAVLVIGIVGGALFWRHSTETAANPQTQQQTQGQQSAPQQSTDPYANFNAPAK